MTDDEFLKRYHAYETTRKDEAIREALTVALNQHDGRHPAVIAFEFSNGDVLYTLMLPSALEAIGGQTLGRMTRIEPYEEARGCST